MGRTFVLRNQWTVRTVRVEGARGLDVRTMQSTVGSLAPYLETQEQGGTVRGKGAHGYRRPTKRAKPARRPVLPRYT